MQQNIIDMLNDVVINNGAVLFTQQIFAHILDRGGGLGEVVLYLILAGRATRNSCYSFTHVKLSSYCSCETDNGWRSSIPLVCLPELAFKIFLSHPYLHHIRFERDKFQLLLYDR